MAIHSPERLIRILFVGGGRGCYDILKLLTTYSMQNVRTEVVGVADPNPEAKGRLLAEELKIPTADSFHHFLEDERKLDLIIELTGNDTVVDDVYRHKGFRVRILDHLGALFLWEIIAIQKKHIELERKVQELDTMAAMGEMAGRLTHELRNPLMIFGGLVRRVMTSPDLGHGLRKRLKRASVQVQRMEEVISDICDVVRPLHPRMEATDMTPFLERWCKDASAEARLMGVSLNARIEADLPAIQVDPSLLRQAFFHLLENSFDAMSEAQGVVDVRAELCWDHIYIIISDTGAGFGDIRMGTAIQPFTSTREGRLGLGLSLCRQIIFSHDGELELRELEEGGTMVIVQLPIVFE
ncbi:MAG: ATP-binding protein [Thermodesulfobacteriota bacterium]